jgi:hypothetical protein
VEIRPRRLAAALVLLGAGCSALAPNPSRRTLHGTGPDQSITIGELEERTRNYADRYVQLIADAVQEIKKRSPAMEVRRTAHLLKLQSASSAWDIVTSSHPLQEMLDLFVQTELQLLIWHEEGQARQTFGEDGAARVGSALIGAQQEILLLVRRALPEAQIRDIQKLIRDWRQRNPDVETGAFIRFGPYLEAPGGTLVSQVMTGFGILNLSHLNPLDPASKSVEHARETADDAFYLAKRLPMLLNWQAEAATYDLLQAVDAAAGAARGTVKEGQSLIRETGEAARALEGTFKALEKITNPPRKEKEKDGEDAAEKPPGRPFDIRDYESAALQAARTAEQARSLLVEARQLAGSPELSGRIRELRGSVERLLAQLLAELLLLLLVFFVLLVAYRVVSRHLFRDRDAPR